MKKSHFVTLAAIVAAGCIAFSFDIQDNNGQAGRTGSPGESTCNITCHTGFALNDGTGSISITSPDLPTWEYMPGDTYNISVTVSRVGNSLFGLGVECLTGSTPAQNAGTLIITNTAQTQIKSISISSVIRRNVVHKLNGGVGTDSKTFTFKWAAPTTNVGNATFYVIGNAANGNNLSSGDHIYRTTQVVTPAPGAGVRESESCSFNLYPNPAHERVTVTYEAATGEAVTVQLLSLDGRELTTLQTTKGDGMKHEEQLDLPADLPAGVYFIRFSVGTVSSVRKIMVQ